MGGKNSNSLTSASISAIYKEMQSLTVEERMIKYSIKKDRAEVILPALTIYNNILRWAGITEINVPKIGLADGLIHHLYDIILKEN
jgi:exopolyphosphatase/guanosine-5'-triphosphate,3'-diphosphate pyrophosphatase